MPNMSAPLTLFAAAALFAAATPEIVEQAGARALVGGPVGVAELGYGPDARQSLWLHSRGERPAPLLVYLHGGGWTAGTPKAGQLAQPDHFTARGAAWATIGYRFVPDVTLEEQLADIAAAVARLRREKPVDAARIVLIGHSSGGHLAALLGTDPRYWAAAGVPFDAIRGVILLDPAAIDATAFLTPGAKGGAIDKHYRPAFGDDRARQWALSPLGQAAAPNAPAWLMLHDAKNIGAGIQSQQLARDLVRAGAGPVFVQPVAETSHVQLNDALGRPGDAATALVDDFLIQLFPSLAEPRRR